MSNQIKNLLLSQFSACHDEEGWFVPLHKSLDGVTTKQALWKQGEDSNSIWGIVSHLTFWNQRYLDRFLEKPLPEGQIDNNLTFSEPNHEKMEGEWFSEVVKTLAVMSEWREAIKLCEPAKLMSPVRENSNEPWLEAIAHINIHNAYHIGQIVQIRKAQGSWN
jgi:uncharacterized damage-inducible protein DinB